MAYKMMEIAVNKTIPSISSAELKKEIAKRLEEERKRKTLEKFNNHTIIANACDSPTTWSKRTFLPYFNEAKRRGLDCSL